MAKLYIYNRRLFMMYQKSMLRLLSLFLFFLCITSAVQSQDLLRNYDLSTVKVDKLSDAEILKFKRQLDASGLTQTQAEQLAISKGMPVSEIQKLRLRLQQLGVTGTGQPKTQINNQQQGNLNQQDTSVNQYLDTVERKPLINPRIFGSELFNNPTLNFQPNIPVATPMNYIIGPGDQLNINVYGVQETSIPITVILILLICPTLTVTRDAPERNVEYAVRPIKELIFCVAFSMLKPATCICPTLGISTFPSGETVKGILVS